MNPDIEIAYSQFAVCDEADAHPFNMWKESHINQCFSWREGSVCFSTELQFGTHELIIANGPQVREPTEFYTFLRCPINFHCDGIIIESHFSKIKIENQQFNMVSYGYLHVPSKPQIYLNFFRSQQPDFSVVKCSGRVFGSEIEINSKPAI